MDALLLGPPGAGKGTQATMLAAKLGACHISTGDILRKAVSSGSGLGLEVKALIEGGQLVPDATVDRLVEERLGQAACAAGAVFDGYPRTVAQAETLEELMSAWRRPLDAALLIELSDEAIVRRIGGRRSCSGCGANYQVEARPPRLEGICDRCGGKLTLRADDREEVVRERLRVYATQTSPLVAFYSKRGLLRRVDGEKGIGEVHAGLLRALGLEEP